ncbi:MAG: Phosphoserine phosphatase, partial [uncultured Solirubrobacteraceae bacterium]
ARAPRRRVLRPRQDAHGGVVRPALGPRRAQCGPAQPPPDGPLRVAEREVPPAGLDGQGHRPGQAGGRRHDPRAPGGRLPAHDPEGSRGRPAAALPADARHRLRPPGRGPPSLHRHRRLPGDGRDDGPRAGLRRGDRRTLGDRRRRLHRPCGRPVHLPRGQGDRASPPGRRGGLRPRHELRLLRLGVRPADAARRRASRRGQPGHRAAARRARAGLGRHALRPARAAAEGWSRARPRRPGRHRGPLGGGAPCGAL